MSSISAIKIPLGVLDEVVGETTAGEKEVIALIALTENLVSFTASLVGHDATLAPLIEGMIRQLGEAAVAGASEHFGITDRERFDDLIRKAQQVIELTKAAAEGAAKEQANVNAQH